MRIIPDQIKKSKTKYTLYLDENTAELLDSYAEFRDCTVEHIISYAVIHALKKDEDFEAHRSKLAPAAAEKTTAATPTVTTPNEPPKATGPKPIEKGTVK